MSRIITSLYYDKQDSSIFMNYFFNEGKVCL
jgi:hypothetical protein